MPTKMMIMILGLVIAALLLVVGCTILSRAPDTGLPTEVLVCSKVFDYLPAEVKRRIAERGIEAVTIGPTTFFLRNSDDICLRKHEAVHREQYLLEGEAFFANYALAYAKEGYLNRYERPAFEVENACAAAR